MLKFKNTTLKADRKDWIYTEANTPYSSANLCAIDCNNEYVAFASNSGNTAGICNYKSPGKVTPNKFDMKGLVSSIRWINDELLSVASGNCIEIFEFDNSNLISKQLKDVGGTANEIANHPTASNIQSFTSNNTISIWDYEINKNLFELEKSSTVESMDWRQNGTTFCSVGNNNEMCIYDPRSAKSAVACTFGHNGIKKTYLAWCGNSDFILSTGFSNLRKREYAIWDVRNFNSALQLNVLDNSQGFLQPLYDTETGIAYLLGKGDVRINMLMIDEQKDTEPANLSMTTFTSPTPFSGSCMIPRTALSVMDCEIARILTIQGSNIVPVSAKVPRKSNIVFHEDLFNDSFTFEKGVTSQEWMAGINKMNPKISLNPQSRSKKPDDVVKIEAVVKDIQVEDVQVTPSAKINLPEHSSYRHILTTSKCKWEDIKIGSPTISNESNGFDSNDLVFAFQVAGIGGRIAICPCKNTGRMGKLSMIINGSELNDFKLMPFDPLTIITGCDDGRIRKFKLNLNSGDDISTPEFEIPAHSGRLLCLAVHPTVCDLIMSASNEMGQGVVKIWNLLKKTCITEVKLTDIPLAFSFENSATSFGVATKDERFNVFDMRTGQLLMQASGHKGNRAARCLYLEGMNAWCSTGFGNGSQREFKIYNNQTGSKPLTISVDQAPAVLNPFFDMDTKVLMLIGKGEKSCYYYDLGLSEPLQLSKGQFNTSETLSFSPAPKISVDVKAVEIIKGFRLCQTSIEEVSVTVPRIKLDYFQDDIFPNSIDFTKSKLSLADWLAGKTVCFEKVSLCPVGMKPFSSIPKTVAVKQIRVFDEVVSEEKKKEQTLQSMFEAANKEADGPLEQDLMEGLADDEWD